MVERTKPLRQRAFSKKGYKTTEIETVRTDEEAIQSSKMNSTTKKRRTWVEKGQTNPKKETIEEKGTLRCAYNNKTTKKKA